MNINSLILTIIAATGLVVTGCNKHSSSTAIPRPAPIAPVASVNWSKLASAFQSAEPGAKNAVDTAVTALVRADYTNALTQLQALAGKYQLTDNQQAAVNEVIATVQKAIADAQAK